MAASPLEAAADASSTSVLVRVKTVDDVIYSIFLESEGSEDALTTLQGCTVGRLKEKLQEEMGLEPARQRLLHAGKQLKDSEPLSNYIKESGMTIHVVARAAEEAASPQVQSPALAGRSPGHQQSPTPVATAAAAVPAPITMIAPWQTLEPLHQGLSTMRLQLLSMGWQPEGTPRQVNEADDGFRSSRALAASLSLQAPHPGYVPSPDSAEGGRQMAGTTATSPTYRRWFIPGMWVDVLDTVEQWLEAIVLAVTDTHVLVHYSGWPSRWDEWLSVASPRIAPFRTHTQHCTLHLAANPLPVNILPNGPHITLPPAFTAAYAGRLGRESGTPAQAPGQPQQPHPAAPAEGARLQVLDGGYRVAADAGRVSVSVAVRDDDVRPTLARVADAHQLVGGLLSRLAELSGEQVMREARRSALLAGAGARAVYGGGSSRGGAGAAATPDRSAVGAAAAVYGTASSSSPFRGGSDGNLTGFAPASPHAESRAPRTLPVPTASSSPPSTSGSGAGGAGGGSGNGSLLPPIRSIDSPVLSDLDSRMPPLLHHRLGTPVTSPLNPGGASGGAGYGTPTRRSTLLPHHLQPLERPLEPASTNDSDNDVPPLEAVPSIFHLSPSASPSRISGSAAAAVSSAEVDEETAARDARVRDFQTGLEDRAEIQHVAAMLAPLLDRFGRVLIDLAPHVHALSRSPGFVSRETTVIPRAGPATATTPLLSRAGASSSTSSAAASSPGREATGASTTDVDASSPFARLREQVSRVRADTARLSDNVARLLADVGAVTQPSGTSAAAPAERDAAAPAAAVPDLSAVAQMIERAAALESTSESLAAALTGVQEEADDMAAASAAAASSAARAAAAAANAPLQPPLRGSPSTLSTLRDAASAGYTALVRGPGSAGGMPGGAGDFDFLSLRQPGFGMPAGDGSVSLLRQSRPVAVGAVQLPLGSLSSQLARSGGAGRGGGGGGAVSGVGSADGWQLLGPADGNMLLHILMRSSLSASAALGRAGGGGAPAAEQQQASGTEGEASGEAEEAAPSSSPTDDEDADADAGSGGP